MLNRQIVCSLVVAMVAALGSRPVLATDRVFGVGTDEYGNLGYDPTVVGDRLIPTLIDNVVDLATGSSGLVIKSDGTVWQVGAPSWQIAGLAGIVSVTSNHGGTFALAADGTVWSMGGARLPHLQGVQAIASGGDFCLALKTDGSVWAWGGNWYGQLGNGTTSPSPYYPCQVIGLPPVVEIAAGEYFALARTRDGALWGWGDNSFGQLGVLTGCGVVRVRTPIQINTISQVVALAAGENFSLMLKSDGRIWASGEDFYGQLGNGISGYTGKLPVQVVGLSDVIAIGIGTGGSDIEPMILSQAITRDGALWVWGCTGMPETADGSMVLCSPTRISDDVKRATGSLVLKNDGTVWTWLNSGRLAGIVNYHTGISSIPGLTEARGLAAAGYHSLVLDSDGKVWAWGSNYVGELGNGSFEWHNPVPSPVVGLADVKAIAAGGWDEFSLGYSVAIKNDGTVWSWGDNRLGQLGCGVFYGQDHMGYDENGDPVHMPDYGFPAPVQVEALTDVVGVAAGTEHTLAVKSDGTVWTWGSNCAGQLGIGSTDWEDARCTPVQVEGLTGVVAVAAAYDYSLALRSDGTVWAWGTNCFGQTGQSMEDLVPPVAPVQVPGLTDVKVIAAGYYHGLAMKTDGTVWAWGGNSFGELGVGTRDDEIREPVQVPGLTNVVAIAAGDYQSLAVKADGTAWAWGDYYGQSSAGPASPTQVLGLKGVKALAAGTGNSFFIADAGSESRPIVTGTWPIAATVERPVHHIVIGFDRPVTNVSVDDLVLSTGTVVSVQGSDSGPYLFTVTDLPGGAIAATLGGDIAGEDGITLASYQWTFTNRPLGDINNDICVNVNDLQLLVASWGQPSTGSGYVADADLNHDGNINVGDLQLLVADWGK